MTLPIDQAAGTSRVLSELAVGYDVPSSFYQTLAPPIKVKGLTGYYPVYLAGQSNRVIDARRAPGTEAKKIDMLVGSDTYSAQHYALKESITDEELNEAENSQEQWNLYEMATYQVTETLKTNYDIEVANIITNTSNLGCYSYVASAWNDYENSSPFTDINTMIDHFWLSNKRNPNVLLMGKEAYDSVKRNDELITKAFETGVSGGAKNINVEALKKLFEIEKVIVAEAFKNTAEEGQDPVEVPIIRDFVLLAFIPDVPGRKKPSYLYTLAPDIKGLNWRTQIFERDPKTGAQEVQVGHYATTKVVAKSYGMGIYNVNCSQ